MVVALLFFLCSTSFSTATRHLESAGNPPPSVTVTGSVFCDTCFQGSLTNELTTTIPGAEVMLKCRGRNGEQVTTALTDKTGVFKLTLRSNYAAKNGERECLVTVVKSPDKNCHIPTNVGSGLAGATLSERGVSGLLNEAVYSVGPFAFRPEKLTCNGEELPSPQQTSPATSSSLFDSIIPPLPPAIFPLPHPGFGYAPPISSAPLFPFYPPPFEFEGPIPESKWPPPPVAFEPPEIVVPPNTRPPLPPSRSSPPPAQAQPIKTPPPFPPHATPHPPPPFKGHSPSPPQTVGHSPPPPYPRKPSPPRSPYPVPTPPKTPNPIPRGKSPPYLPAPHPASAPRRAPPLPAHSKPPPPARYCPP